MFVAAAPSSVLSRAPAANANVVTSINKGQTAQVSAWVTSGNKISAQAAQVSVWSLRARAFALLFASAAVGALVAGLCVGLLMPRQTSATAPCPPNVTTIVPVPGPTVDKPAWYVDPPFPPEDPLDTWSYDPESPKGPEHWLTLKDSSGSPKFPECSGSTQSPVALTDATSQAQGPAPLLARNYTGMSNFTLETRPNGHVGFQVIQTPGAGQVGGTWVVDGVAYEYVQFHHHTPSEHTVNGESFPLEAHFVHRAADQSLAVFSILYPAAPRREEGSNPYLQFWWDSIFIDEKLVLASGIELEGLINDLSPDAPLFRYTGSLTAPPCTQGVKWFVAVSASPVNIPEVITYQYLVELIPNKRAAQPLNGRVPQRFTLGYPFSTSQA